MFSNIIDEELDDGLDAHESEEHAELEIALFEAASPTQKGQILARGKAAHDAGRLSRKAWRELLAASGQERFWDRFMR